MIQDSTSFSRRETVRQKLSDGKHLCAFYNFAALNPHLELNEIFQIMSSRNDLGVCYSFDEWRTWGRSIIGGRRGIRFYDRLGYRCYVFDEKDTHGDSKYLRQALPLRRILQGIDEINGTNLAESQDGDYQKIEKGVREYLSSYGYLSDNDERNTLMIEGISYSLYCKTRQPKEEVKLHGLPYSIHENTELLNSIILLTTVLQGEIQNAYEQRRMKAWKEGKSGKAVEQTEGNGADENIATPTAETLTEALSEADGNIVEGNTDNLAESEATSENIAPEKLNEISPKTDENIVALKPTQKTKSPANSEIVIPKQLSPMWQKYFDEQQKYPHAVILIRVGDFYEVLGEKAIEVATELDLMLTGRNLGLQERTPMCGFPYHVTDKYIEKILEYHSIVYLDGKEEPKYILSHAEGRGEIPVRSEPLTLPNEPQESLDKPSEVENLSDNEEDEEEWDEDYEEYDYDPSMEVEDEPKEIVKNVEKPKIKESKPRQGLKQRKRDQPTLFDLFMPREKSPTEQMIERQLKRGSSFENGKFRIYDFYSQNPTKSEFAAFLKKEYGIGGFGGYGGDEQSHDGKGLKMAARGERGEYLLQVFLKWEEVAVRIADLIDDENYFSEKDKAEYEKYKVKQTTQQKEREQAEKEKNEFLKWVITNTVAERKQRILDEYAKTTELNAFANFLQKVYGNCIESNELFRAQYHPMGAWLTKYDTAGNTVARYSLSWNEFADRVCVLIENDEYITETVKKKREPSLNRFKQLSEAGKATLDSCARAMNREPFDTPWGEIQHCHRIVNGIYSVSTAGHGGIMVRKELARFILSTEALERGDLSYGFYCYEEDSAACIPLRELYDKGILTPANEYFTHYYVSSERPEADRGSILFTNATEAEKTAFIKWWNNAINESLAQYHHEYWQAYKQAEENEIESTQENGDALASAFVVENAAQNTDLSAVGFDQNELGGAKARFRGNVEAIRLSRALENFNRKSTQGERKILARFVGWGALSQAFDEQNAAWKSEYNELKALLSADEYEKAKGSTLNAHYTSKEVIDGIYAALKRFGVKENNRILEPAMGTGNFFGFMPKEISDGAKLYGVELDQITGRIATQLYPNAKIQIKGYEETKFPNNYFDLVVGNVPFGGYTVFDSEYAKHSFYIHDYFLAKSIDKLKPNGIMAVITSKGTMDKQNSTVRKYLADRADLLGAIRLPNDAFKQTAGTKVVSDILFLRKRQEKINATQDTDEWISVGKNDEGYEINRYFINHPDMILGTLAIEKGLYASDELTVKSDGRILSDALLKAVENLPTNFYSNPEFEQESVQENEVDFEVRPLCYKVENRKLYMRMGDQMVEQTIPKFPHDAYDRIKGMIALRNQLRHILDIQIKGCDDRQLEAEQASLNYQYDAFVRKYGNLSSRVNSKLFKEDGDSALLFACEGIDKQTKAIRKADIFSKRTIRPYSAITSTNDCFEALQICKNEHGKVDISYIEDLTKNDYETVLLELGNAVFRDPTKIDKDNKYSGFVSAEEYLSGEVGRKLELARKYATENPHAGFEKNIKALEEVQPTPLTATEISVRLGASWIDKKYYKDFFCELMEVNPRTYYDRLVTLYYNQHDSSWRVDQKYEFRNRSEMKQNKVYGTDRASACRLFEDALNLRDTTIYDIQTVDGVEKRVLNKRATVAAREKQNQIKDSFRKWIFATPERRADLERTYNALFNKIRLPSYDGSYLKFPEMNPEIKLRPHQVNAIDRIIVAPKSTLLHHVVGSGKTYTMITAAMKLRQYGIAKKPMFAVPNHLVEQWADSWRKIYPNAHILIAEKEDLVKEKRQKFVSKVALGDWDGIIIAQSSFAKIPVSKERQIAKMQEELDSIEMSIREQSQREGKDHGSVKNLMRIKKSREAALKKLMDDTKKDSVLIFENLGVDYLFVDEAHMFKNLFLYSKMNNVAGINSSSASQRASDLKLKCEYLQELHGSDRGIVFGTATPISNSMTEMYTMQRYLQPTTLREIGINYFDEWAADFGETVTSMEMSPSGQGFRTRTRFSKFVNLPENLKLYRSFADVQTSEQVKLPVPEVVRETVKLKPSEQILKYAQEIADRAERIYNGSVDPHIDNMLKVTSDGKKLALDVRCFDRTAESEEESKVNLCAVKVKEIWEKSKDTRGTQLVFCDLSTPKKPFSDYEYGKDFDVYNELKYKLVKFGIPEKEIAFIHDAKTDKEKQALFNAVNNGDIRVFIGSTEKCGAGMNVQNKLIALHHLDTPYRPSDMEQREGRIIRQGNENSIVQIFTYVMERTFDSYSYQILENKQRFISQINRGDLTVRVAEDIDEATLSYAQIKAITSGNPKILRKMQLDEDVAKLKILEGEYLRNLYRLQDLAKIELPEKIRQQELFLSRVRSDMELIKVKRGDEFSMSINGKVYADKKECAEALWNAVNGEVDKPFGEFCGFTLRMKPSNFLYSERTLILSAIGQYEIEVGTSATGNLTRLENFIASFPEREARVLEQLDKLKRDLQVAEEQAQVPFEKAEELSELQKEQLTLNEELSLEKREEIITGSDEETGNGGDEETEDDDIDNMEETMTDDVNFMGVPEKESYASRTRHGYEVKATFDNGERIFVIIERGRAGEHDYIIGCGYDKRTGEWAQGLYGFSTYEKAQKYMQEKYPDFKELTQVIKPSDYYQAVKESVKAEYEAFYNEELKKPPEELIARDNYRIRFYNELSVFLEDHSSENLSGRDVQALYEDSPHILSLLYEYFLDNEYASINTYEDTKELITYYNDKYHAQIVNDRDVYKTSPTYLPIYMESIGYAKEHGELDKYKASRQENLNCGTEIESSIRENYDGAHLNTNFIDGLVEKFGYERVMFVCAKTINEHNYDGRYSRENKAWAKTIPMPSENTMIEVAVSTHPAIFDGFTRSLIKKYQESLIGKKEEKEMPEQVTENKKTWLTFKVSANAAIRTYDNSTFMRMPQDSEDYKDFTYNLFNNRMKEATMDEEVKKEPCFEVRIASDEQIKIVNRDGEEKYIPAEEFIKLVGGKRAESYRREGSEKIEFQIPKEAVVEEREKYFILSTPTNSKYKGRTFTLPSAALTATETGYNVGLFENFRANIRWGESDVKVSADELQKLCGSTSGSDYVRAPSQMEEYREQEGNVVFELNERAVIAEYDKTVLVKMPKGEFSGYTCYIPKKYAALEEGEKPQFTLPEDYNILLKDRLNSRETSLSASEFASVHRDKTERDYTGFFVKPSETSVRALEATEANLRKNLPEEMLNRPNWVAVRTRINPKTNRLDKFLIDVHTDEFAKSDDPSTWADFDSACEYAKNNGCTALAYALDGKDNIVCLDVDDCIDEKNVCSDTAFDCMENTRGTYCERSVSGKGLHFLGKSEGIRGYKVYSHDGEMELYQRGQFITLTGDVNGGNEIKSFDTPQMRLFIEERFDKREEIKGVGKGVEGLSHMSDREVLDKAMGAYNGETFKAYYEGKDLKENHSNSDMAFMNMLAFWCRHDVDQMQRIFATSGLYRPEKSADYYEHTARKAIKATPMLTLKKAPSALKPIKSGGNSKV